MTYSIKRVFSLLLTIAMLVSMIPIIGATDVAAIAVDNNLIVGGDFNDAERGLGYFKADYETDGLVYLPSGGEDGSGCVGIRMQQKTYDGNWANICMRYDDGSGYNLPLYPGNTYSMSFKVYNPTNSGIAWMNMGIEAFEKVDGAHWALAATPTQGSWVTVSQTFTVPEAPDNTAFRIYGGYQQSDGETMVLVDDISIVDVTPNNGNLFMGGDFNDVDFGVGYFRAEYNSTALTYLPNGGPDGSGCVGLNLDSSLATGNACLMYADDNGGRAVPILPGRTYTMSCDIYNPSDVPIEWLNMDFQNKDNNSMADAASSTNLKDQWVHLENTFTVPEDRTDMIWRIFGGFANNNGTQGLIKIDNVSMIDVTPYSENLLVGGDMESQNVADAYYTITYDGGIRTWLPDGGVGGSGCMELSVNASGNNALINPIYNGKPLEIGKAYTISCDVYIPKNTVQCCFIDLEAGGNLDGWKLGPRGPWSYRSGQWQRINSTFVYDGTSFGLRIFAPAKEGANTNLKIRIDNVSLRCTDASVKRVAAINGMAYTSLEAAYAAVQPNETVTLQNDLTVAHVFHLPANVTLDLNGYTLTTDNLFSFGNVIDSSNGQGGVKISNDRTKAFMQLQDDNAALPLYDTANGCYRFFNYSLMFKTKAARENYNRYAIRLDLPNEEAYALLADPANRGTISAELLMGNEDGTVRRIQYVFSDATLAKYADKAANSENPQAILLTLTGGGSSFDKRNIKVTGQFNSLTGMQDDGEVLFDYERAKAWILSQIENNTLFSFTYGGTAYADHIGNWEKTVERTDAGWTVTYTNGNVVAWSEITLNAETASVEWTNYFKNKGSSNSPVISNIRAINSTVAVQNPTFTGANGSTAAATDFQPYSVDLTQSTTWNMQTSGGRSSQSAFPYFEISNGEYGVMGGIGWTGNWNANFANNNGNITIDAGMQSVSTYLTAGEQMRTPMIMLQFYKGDQNDGHNALRELMLKSYTPVDADTGKPLEYGMLKAAVTNRVGLGEDAILTELQGNDVGGAKYEALEIDAGWYGDKATDNNLGNQDIWMKQVGNWYFIPSVYQDSDGNGTRDIRELSQYLQANDKDLVLWFEPERVYKYTELYNAHKNSGYLLYDGNPLMTSRLWNFANDKACDFMIDLVDNFIEENNVTWYRHDQNGIDPDGYWSYEDDGTNRIGMTEIKYITNLYRYLDTLVERNPGLMIDSCASGGRRLDLEMMKRSLPLWNSDYGNAESSTPDGIRNINYNLSWWLPIHGGKYPYYNAKDTTYNFRVAMNSSMGLDMGATLDGTIQNLTEQYYTCREMMNGQYYKLDETNLGAAYEFYKADDNQGYILAFGDVDYAHNYALKGLNPNALYAVTSADTGQRRVHTGASLINNGLTVTHTEDSRSQLFYINEI